MGATFIHGVLTLLIEWQDAEPELIPAKIVGQHAPQSLIAFYQERITFVPRKVSTEIIKINMGNANGVDRFETQTVEEILGAKEDDGKIEFLVKWRNDDDVDWVPAEIANQRIPQLVIEFYEERISFLADSDDSDDDE